MVGDTAWPRALAKLPLISIEKIGEAAPKPWPAGDRPLAGIRVLDLSRVIAGPVAGRTLAAHGADVLLISGPDLPAIPWLTIDTGRGKLTTLPRAAQRSRAAARCAASCAQADILSQGYRPQAIARLGFSPEEAARINPGIVYVTLSAYGHAGPWADRRGFDLAGADHDRLQPCRRAGGRGRRAEGIAGPDARPRHRVFHGVRRHDGEGRGRPARAAAGTSGCRWRRPGAGCGISAALPGGLATEDLKADAVQPFIEAACRPALATLSSVRHAADAVEDPGALVPSGHAARQPLLRVSVPEFPG